MGTEKKFARKLILKGGKYWNKYGKERVYFDVLKIMEIAGVSLSYFNTGNISSATFDDDRISNNQANIIQKKLEKGNTQNKSDNQNCIRHINLFPTHVGMNFL
ncbi:MAG: hypothetical protein JEZ00_21670 [Anaerolineaceae bacterium]|nr:hypothetical protein [Anaerolineaceae bacterium]